MDTHLTVINPSVVRERELALQQLHARENAATLPAIHGPTTTGEERVHAREGRLADLLATVLFTSLVAGVLVLLLASL